MQFALATIDAHAGHAARPTDPRQQRIDRRVVAVDDHRFESLAEANLYWGGADSRAQPGRGARAHVCAEQHHHITKLELAQLRCTQQCNRHWQLEHALHWESVVRRHPDLIARDQVFRLHANPRRRGIDDRLQVALQCRRRRKCHHRDH